MLLWQLVGEAAVIALLIAVLNGFLSQFKTSRKGLYPLYIAMPLFAAGFAMRLAENKSVIDFGFFLTEVSYLFVYVLFTAALILGQKRYWKLG
ncbi:hypothetical protein HYY73_01145 [Candidatus Woesearchaeota archaeon]|nr:hypothetical protein [Candidatus Woesearchaeota archaeon]